MLSPNALRILDAIGVFERVRNKGFHFEAMTFKDEPNKTTDVYYFSQDELYGYKAFRVYRQVLIGELKLVLGERGIEVKYEAKYTHIVAETSENVEFAFADGSTSTASLLLGADGIHSTLRKAIYPTVRIQVPRLRRHDFRRPKIPTPFPRKRPQLSTPRNHCGQTWCLHHSAAKRRWLGGADWDSRRLFGAGQSGME